MPYDCRPGRGVRMGVAIPSADTVFIPIHSLSPAYTALRLSVSLSCLLLSLVRQRTNYRTNVLSPSRCQVGWLVPLRWSPGWSCLTGWALVGRGGWCYLLPRLVLSARRGMRAGTSGCTKAPGPPLIAVRHEWMCLFRPCYSLQDMESSSFFPRLQTKNKKQQQSNKIRQTYIHMILMN